MENIEIRDAAVKERDQLRAELATICSVIDSIFADRRVNGMSHAECLRAVKDKCDRLEGELAKHTITVDESKELQDVLRTLSPYGNVLIKSARELVKCWELQATRLYELNSKLSAEIAARAEDQRRADKLVEAAQGLIKSWTETDDRNLQMRHIAALENTLADYTSTERLI